MTHAIERKKAYAAHLLKTALRYGSEAEVAAIITVIESQIGKMLTERFNPGLNDASYAVFRKFWLKGGEQ
jgi:hypothetical protein